ncbi:NAD(P)-binding domain-containing protein [Artemisia annua]|uniref:NAD(P)-binding domain-containing protein n=1 Tax=Artemisia annua TaxID=35608 RepID=A0A2U1PD78_ARTAN|nr:NAD(P)-binding domain-containing protein [Artemisia annua]
MWWMKPGFRLHCQLWYPLSKTLAEDAAVKFAKENGLDLVSIHPGYVIGPMLQPTLNFTSEGIINLIKFGTKLYSDGIYRLVDVRDVADAHILAFENPKAKGRYLMVGTMIPSSEIMEIINKVYPALGQFQRYKESSSVESLTYNVSRARAEDLGVEFTPVEITIKDTVESLKENNLLNF